MRTILYIARRYLFARKSHNVINIISSISVIGVSVGTMALVVILSVFNGFESLIASLFNSFDPDIKITAIQGKTFVLDSVQLKEILSIEGVAGYSEVVEENALLKYDDQQYIATLKGVSENYARLSGVDSMVTDGDFLLQHNDKPYAVIGQGVAYYLSIGLNFINPLVIYVPKRDEKISFNPEKAFNKKIVFPSAFFSVEKDIDARYVLLPLWFVRELLDYNKECTSLEIYLKPAIQAENVQGQIKEVIGDKYHVKNRYEQQEFFYKVMRSEKWAIFFILTFILVVATFNVIGSLTMLIIEKKHDMWILRSMGANEKFIRTIFLSEGWFISVLGALIGIFFGSLICYLQQTFGFVKLQGTSSFIIQAYPVELHYTDLLHIFLTVLLIGHIAARFPVRYITRKHLIGFQ